MDGCKGTQVYALNPAGPGGGGGGGSGGDKLFHHLQDHLMANSITSKGNRTCQAPNQAAINAIADSLLPYGLPLTDLLEPKIDQCLKSVDFVETLADLYRRIESCPQFEKSKIYLEQFAIFRGLYDPKLFRRSLRSARQHAVDVHTKVVLAAMLRSRGEADNEFDMEDEECSTSEEEASRNRREMINFSKNGISVEGMKAVEIFSRTKRLDSFEPQIVLELLSLANKFCCDEMKSASDAHLASLVCDMECAMMLIDYGLEENAYLLVAACLQIAMEEDMKSNTTVMLLERLGECASENWQKQLAFHQLGVVMLERKEYKDASRWFGAAAEAGHIYSLVGVARAKYKRGHMYSAYKQMNSLLSNYTPVGWMHQERSLYCIGKEKMMDLSSATELDPTLSYPYKFRAVTLLEEKKIGAAISEINKILAFKVYEGGLRDVRALLTLDPNYMMFHGKMQGDHLVELLQPLVQKYSQADCWMQLYDRWSSVDDIGSLAVVHHMLANDPGRAFTVSQSLLLLRSFGQGRAIHTLQRSFEAFFLKAYALADTSLDQESSMYVIQLLQEALRCPSDGLRKGQALNNLGSVYVDCDKLDLAADCYTNALNIKHTRAHQGLARVYHLKNLRKSAYDEMTKLIEKARNNASAYEKRSEYCDRDMAKSDLSMASRLDPLRTYPYRYRAAVLMDDHKEKEAIAELTKAIAFKPDLQLLYLRAAFHESMNDYIATIRDCEAALCLDPGHADTVELYNKTKERMQIPWPLRDEEIQDEKREFGFEKWKRK
ncbi:hypothetical protein FNV43_RR09641 [Rhamnella rubrinervis]|uniref:Uncharacterized protein n=1 Tax=Rhamnella rubrinervis TaxID=2594499 RepID=A0A8K0HB61_9ROSA|nr:hypothetical protein FNV43_RR09641 [Rhamnella rubrinervis]